MGDGRGRSWRTIGCTALLSGAIAFPAGWLLSGRTSEAVPQGEPLSQSATGRTPRGGGIRNMYTAQPLSDPVVIQEHLRVVEAMERGCRFDGDGCAEAAAARRLMDARTRR